MRFGRIWTLRGPSIWSRTPVIEAEVHADTRPTPESSSTGRDICRPRSATRAPARPSHRRRARARPASTASSSTTTRKPSRGLPSASVRRMTSDVAALRHLAHDIRLGPSTRGIVTAALARGIPVRRLTGGSLVQLGWAKKLHRIWTAETDQTPLLAETIAQDKELTRDLLHEVGVPVPGGRPVDRCRGRLGRRRGDRPAGRRQAAVRQPGSRRRHQPHAPANRSWPPTPPPDRRAPTSWSRSTCPARPPPAGRRRQARRRGAARAGPRRRRRPSRPSTQLIAEVEQGPAPQRRPRHAAQLHQDRRRGPRRPRRAGLHARLRARRRRQRADPPQREPQHRRHRDGRDRPRSPRHRRRAIDAARAVGLDIAGVDVVRRGHRPAAGGAGRRHRRGQCRARPAHAPGAVRRPAARRRRGHRRRCCSRRARTAGSRSSPSPASTARRPRRG